MPDKIKLTQSVVKNLQPPNGKKQADVWDSEQPNFGVRIGASGSKTFIVISRVNGRVVRSTVGKFPTMNLEDARKRARKILVDMADGVNPNEERRERNQGTLTLRSVFESYLQTRKNLSENTIKEYKGTFERHLSPWKNRQVLDISTAMVLDRHQQIGETKGKNVANQSMRLLRSIMNFSRSTHGVPKENPAAVMSQAQAWYKDGKRSVIVKASEMPAFFREVGALENDTGRDYLMLLLFTGLRRNEAMSLHWDNVDLKERILTIPDTKNGEPHALPLSNHLLDLLKDRQERWGSKGWVFPSWSGKGHITYVQHVQNRLREKGVNFTLHDLRRTFITVAESLDISTYVVKRLANHKQSDVTGKHYIVHDITRLREPMERISAALLEMGKAS
jgi:integrase